MSQISTPPSAEGSSRFAPLGLWDWIWMGAVLLLFALYSYARSRHRIFWGDELNAFVLMQQKSFWAMMHNWRLSLDSGSLFYACVGYWWVRVFSPPEMALRAFSAAGMGASLVILWITARRFFSLAIVGACLPLAYVLNEYVRWQFYNGRMYGGFMLATSLVIYAFVRAAPGQTLTNRVLVLTFCAHLLLMSSHVLGLLYSGAFVAGLVAQDLWARTFRPRLYLSAVASWLILLITYANIKNTAALSKFGYFTQTPHLHDLIKGITVYSQSMLIVLAVLSAAALLAYLLLPTARQKERLQPTRTSLYFVLLCCAAILLVTFAVSRVTTSIFYNRYLLPVYLGDALLMCELLHCIAARLPRSSAGEFAGAAGFVFIFLVAYIREFPRAFSIPTFDYTRELMEKAPGRLPMVITDPGIFSELDHYHGSERITVTPLDWSVSVGQGADVATAPGTLQLERWQAGGIFVGRILSTETVLARFPDFITLNTADHSLWFQRYVRNNPKYVAVKEGTYQDQEFWLVHTRIPALHEASTRTQRRVAH